MTDPVTTFEGNFDALPPATRRAIEAARGDRIVQIHTIGALLSASVQTPDKRWVRLHSGQDPVTEAERFLDRALPAAAPPVAMVIGPGLGYVLEALERRSAETRVIAIEPFAAMTRAMLERRDWRGRLKSGRLMLLVGPEYLGASDAWRLVDAEAGSTPVLEHPVLGREFPDEASRARGVATHIVRGAEANADARKRLAGRYLLNTLKNLPALLAEGNVSALRDAFRATPAIVVAAGPSLDHQLDHLRAVADRALIVAIDSALRPLNFAGIRPHLVVTVGSDELNARHLAGLADTDTTWLVGEGSVAPSVFPEFAGHAFTFRVSGHHPWPWLRTHGFDAGTLRAWGWVLTTAFDLACEAGCDPIMFVGADLAYTNGLRQARNTVLDASATAECAGRLMQHQRENCETEDIRGNPALTTPRLVQFRDWLLSRAAEVGTRRVLNATGAGILHGPGITQVDVAAMPVADHPLNPAARLARAWSRSLDRRSHVRQRLEEATLASTGGGIPLEEWLKFAGALVPGHDITAYIETARTTPPVITTHPVDRLGIPGTTTHYTAAASAGLTPTVQWQMTSDGGESWSDIAGATTTTYAFTAAACDIGKQFRAVFTNARGSAATAPGSLTSTIRGTVICGLGERGRWSLFHRRESQHVVAFAVPAIDEDTPRDFAGLPVVDFAALSSLQPDRVVVAMPSALGCYVELTGRWNVPSERIEIEVESVHGEGFVRPESKRLKSGHKHGESRADGALRYFLVNCEGRAGSRWLGASLHMHPDIACAVGDDHPYVGFDHRYNEDELHRVLMFCAEHPDRFSSSAYYHEVINSVLAGHGMSLERRERDFDMNPVTIFDELDLLIEARLFGPVRAAGNVHGTNCQRVASCISRFADPFRGRKPVMVQMCRHPVTRFESRVSAHERFHVRKRLAEWERRQIDGYCDENRDALRSLEKEYGADFSRLKDRLFFYMSRCIRYQDVWAREVMCYDVDTWPFERLHSDPDYFASLVSDLTQGAVEADRAYLDRVFSPRNLVSGRGEAERDLSQRPVDDPREQFLLWSPWQQEEFRRSVRELGLQKVYAKVGYDFSFAA